MVATEQTKRQSEGLDIDLWQKRLSQRIVQQLQDGSARFMRGWNPASNRYRLPYNAASDKSFNGANTLALMLASDALGYKDPRWTTYGQAKNIKWFIPQSSKGVPLIFWTDVKFQKIKGEDGKDQTIEVKLSQPEVLTPRVFNASLFKNAEPLPAGLRLFDKNPAHRAEEIIEATEAEIDYRDGDRAFYQASTNTLILPSPDRIASDATYHAKTMQAVFEWARRRMYPNRTQMDPESGEYAAEKLVATLYGFFLADRIGVPHFPRENEKYVPKWIEMLNQIDPLLHDLANEASETVNFVMEALLKHEKQANKELAFASDSNSNDAPQFAPSDTIIHVLRSDNIKVKDMGAVWNGKLETLVVPKGKDLRPFAPWLTEEARIASEAERAQRAQAEAERKRKANLGNSDKNSANRENKPWEPGQPLPEGAVSEITVLHTTFEDREEIFAINLQNNKHAQFKYKDKTINDDPGAGVVPPNRWFIPAGCDIRPYAKFIGESAAQRVSTHLKQKSAQRNAAHLPQPSWRQGDPLPEGAVDMITILHTVYEDRETMRGINERVGHYAQFKKKDEALEDEPGAGIVPPSTWFIPAGYDIRPFTQFIGLEAEERADSIRSRQESSRQIWKEGDALVEGAVPYVTTLHTGPNDRDKLNEIRDLVTPSNAATFKRGEPHPLDPSNEVKPFHWFLPAGVDTRPYANYIGDEARKRVEADKKAQNERKRKEGLYGDRDKECVTLYVLRDEVETIKNKDGVAWKGKDAKLDDYPGAGIVPSKSWYLIPGTDPTPFAKYLTDAARQAVSIERSTLVVRAASDDEVQQAFADFLWEIGLDVSDPVMDGKKHRAALEGAKGKKKDGVYKAFLDDYPSGWAINYLKSEDPIKWTFTSERKVLTAEEAAEERRKREEREQKRKQEEREEKAQMAKLWNSVQLSYKKGRAQTEKDKSFYQIKKKLTYLDPSVRICSERVAVAEKTNTETGEVTKRYEYQDVLYIPATDLEGNLESMQRIYKEDALKDKDFVWGRPLNGTVHIIGEIQIDAPIFVCEGWATGISIHEATGYPVVCAWAKGGIRPVVKALLEKYPNNRIVILGDNDRVQKETKEKQREATGKGLTGIDALVSASDLYENAGLRAGLNAAKAHNLTIGVPVFRNLNNKPTDFNDLAVTEGIEETRRQINNILALTPEASWAVAESGIGEVIVRPEEIDMNRLHEYATEFLTKKFGTIPDGMIGRANQDEKKTEPEYNPIESSSQRGFRGGP